MNKADLIKKALKERQRKEQIISQGQPNLGASTMQELVLKEREERIDKIDELKGNVRRVHKPNRNIVQQKPAEFDDDDNDTDLGKKLKSLGKKIPTRRRY